MAKRIYWESVKKWAIGAGIPVGIASFALLFIYLAFLGVIEVTDYSGDMICAGTESDPCIALIDFTAKDDIFIYPRDYDPYGRNTPFETDVGLKSWKMYRSWGTGWREIKLNETCRGTWCGGKHGLKNNKYSFAFRTDKNYSIKIVAYKEDPNEDIKWGFGPVDPAWFGEAKEFSDEASLDRNTGELELSKWNKEAWFKIRTEEDPVSFSLVEEKENLEFEKYNLSVQSIGENLEYDIILKEKPLTNKFNFLVDSENLSFYYQSALNATGRPGREDCNETNCWGELKVIRPENVVGSYAVYHSSKSDNKYMAGKAFHIYRPLIIDAKNDSIWAELDINKSVLTITINQEWLNKAAYPVIIDPSFGFTGIGETPMGGVKIMGSWFNCTENGTADTLTSHFSFSSSTSNIKGALYNKTEIGYEAETEERADVDTTLQWWSFDFSGSPEVYNKSYWIMLWSTETYYISADDLTDKTFYNNDAYGSWPTLLTGTITDYKLSMYVNYTVSGPDVTPPYFTDGTPINQTLDNQTALSYDINASDETALSCFTVNDTTNFKIDCDGLLQNNTQLSVGLYNLNITINDTSNNLNSTLMWVNVTAPAADTCTCPGAGNNWEVDMEDYCNLTTACTLTTGNLSWIGSSGYFNCSTNLNLTNRDAPPNNTIFYFSDGCEVIHLIILIFISITNRFNKLDYFKIT